MTASVLVGCERAVEPLDVLDDFIRLEMEHNHVPGLAVSVVKDGSRKWSKGYGWADIGRRVAMTPDVVQNIGSISKPVVTTIIMQCVERGMFSLDDDINDYLSFKIRNPNYPGSAITCAQLLSHYSSIADGSSYGYGYRCGESSVSLQDWIEGYFGPGGDYYEATENFHAWAPGEKYEYNNVAFAVLAYLIEVVANKPFDDYCHENLFAPLDMADTSWFLANIDKSRHATPYAYVTKGKINSPSWGGIDLELVNGEQPAVDFEGLYADCIYDHPNFADGFLRTSVSDMTNFQLMLMANGTFNGHHILKEHTVRQMFSGDGLTWSERELPGGIRAWGHGGGDPGVSASFDFQLQSGNGVIVFANTYGASLDDIVARLFSQIDFI